MGVSADEFRYRAVLCARWRGVVPTVGDAEFYGGSLDGVEQNIVLEPEWVRQSIVVTATGTPLPQAQVSASITNLSKTDFINRADMVDVMRQVAGINVVQTGQRGGVASIFVRGGNSDANKILLDGVPIEDIGGVFDLSTIASTGVRMRKRIAGLTACFMDRMPQRA